MAARKAIAAAGVVLFQLIPVLTDGAFEERMVPTSSAAMGGAYASLFLYDSPMFGNPAALSYVNSFTGGILYRRPFGMKELAESGIYICFPAGSGAFGLAASDFGFALYGEQTLNARWGKTFANGISAGGGVRYMSLGIDGYGNTAAVGVDIGFSSALGEKLRIGISGRNLNEPGLSGDAGSVRRSVRIGASWRVSAGLAVTGEIYKEGMFPSTLIFGSEISAAEHVTIILGVAEKPSLFSGGFGLSFGLFRLDYAVANHQYLGVTHQISLGFVK